MHMTKVVRQYSSQMENPKPQLSTWQTQHGMAKSSTFIILMTIHSILDISKGWPESWKNEATMLLGSMLSVRSSSAMVQQCNAAARISFSTPMISSMSNPCSRHTVKLPILASYSSQNSIVNLIPLNKSGDMQSMYITSFHHLQELKMSKQIYRRHWKLCL